MFNSSKINNGDILVLVNLGPPEKLAVKNAGRVERMAGGHAGDID